MEQIPSGAVIPAGVIATMPPPFAVGEMMVSIFAAAKDGSVDPAKLNGLLSFAERMMKIDAEQAFNQAMCHVQTVLPPITKSGIILNKNGTVRSRFGKIEDIQQVINPLLAADGLACSFTVNWIENKLITVVLTIRHIKGHSTEQQFTVPFERDNYRTAAQDAGSANSFAKRYALVNAFNIVLIDSDDDGQSLGAEPITVEQKNRILDLIIATKANEQGFLATMKVAAVDDIVQNQFERAIGLLQLKQRQMEEKARR